MVQRKDGYGWEGLTRLDERSLEHVRQQRQDGVKRGELGLSGGVTVLDTSEKLSQDRQVQNERSCQEGILFQSRKRKHGCNTTKV